MQDFQSESQAAPDATLLAAELYPARQIICEAFKYGTEQGILPKIRAKPLIANLYSRQTLWELNNLCSQGQWLSLRK